MRGVPASRVLIVADAHALLRLLSRLPQQDGFSITAVDPAEADFFALGQEVPPYDVVVINSFLPDFSANEAAEQIGSLFPGAVVLHVDDESHGCSSSIACWIECTSWPEPSTGGRTEASPAWK